MYPGQIEDSGISIWTADNLRRHQRCEMSANTKVLWTLLYTELYQTNVCAFVSEKESFAKKLLS
jgi:hypothetical protein